MTDNAFGSAPSDLYRFCEDQNQLPVSKMNGWWYYVSRNPDTGQHTIQKLEGGLGEEVQRYAQGWRTDFANWSEKDCQANDRRLASFVKRGTIPAQGVMV